MGENSTSSTTTTPETKKDTQARGKFTKSPICQEPKAKQWLKWQTKLLMGEPGEEEEEGVNRMEESRNDSDSGKAATEQGRMITLGEKARCPSQRC